MLFRHSSRISGVFLPWTEDYTILLAKRTVYPMFAMHLEVKTRQLKKSFSNATNLGCPGSKSQKILLLGDLQTDSWCMVTCQFLQMRWTVASNSLGCRTVRYCVSPVSVDIRVSPICVDTCCENPFLRGLLRFQTTESRPMPHWTWGWNHWSFGF